MVFTLRRFRFGIVGPLAEK
jgi:hypothetical protein